VPRSRTLPLGRLVALLLTLLAIALPPLASARAQPRAAAAATSPLLVTNTVAEDPLVGGTVKWTVTVTNDGGFPGAAPSRAYNVDIVNLLPIGVTVTGVSPASAAYSVMNLPSNPVTPAYPTQQQLTFTNITDLVVNQSYSLTITGQLNPALTPDGPPLLNTASARGSTDPRNLATHPTTGQATADVATSARILPFRLKKSTAQSTGVNQATGGVDPTTGQCVPAPTTPQEDRRFAYDLTIINNPQRASTTLIVTDTLPYGVVYCASTLPAGVTQDTPIYNANGTTTLVYRQATIASGATSSITVQVAIPYTYPTVQGTVTVNNTAAHAPGTVIADGETFINAATLTGTYPTGTANPYSTSPVTSPVTAKYATIAKTSSLATVDYTSVVNYCLTYYTSAYYDTSNVSVADTLPNGQDYVAGSARVANADCVTPGAAFPPNFTSPQIDPANGTTRLTWPINTPAPDPATPTTAARSFGIAFQATIRPTYTFTATSPPVVAGDSFTNRVVANYDAASNGPLPANSVSGRSDTASAGQGTGLPTFVKTVTDVRNGTDTAAPPSGEGRVIDAHAATAAVGDIVTFVLTYTAPANIDQKDIVVTDFLPLNFALHGTPVYTGSTYTGGVTADLGCPTLPCAAGGTLTFKLTGAANNTIVPKGNTFVVTLRARMVTYPAIAANAITGNLGKLSGANSDGTYAYSARDVADITVLRPRLSIDKTNNVAAPIIGDKVFDYTIKVKNEGNASAYQPVDLIDTLPGDIQYCATTAIHPTCATPFTASPAGAATLVTPASTAFGGTLTVAFAANTVLAPGATITLTIRVKIQPAPVIGTQETNTATIASYNSQPPGGAGESRGPVTGDNTITIGGDTLAKTSVLVTPSINGDGRATVGDVVHIVITYTLPAQTTVFNAEIRECLPLGFHYLASTYVGTATGAPLPSPAGFATTEAGPPAITRADGTSPCPTDQQQLVIPVGSQVNTTGPIILTMALDARIDGKNQAGGPVFTNTNAPNNTRSDGTTPNENRVYLYTTPAAANTGLALVTSRIVRNQSDTATNDVWLPRLALSQTASNPNNYTQVGGSSTPPPPIVRAGDTVFFLLTLTNTGGSTAHDLGPLVDTLDANLTPVSIRPFPVGATPTACPAPGTGSAVAAVGQTFTLPFAAGTTLAQGASLYACVEATVKNPVPFPYSTDFPNTVDLGATAAGSDYYSGPATVPTNERRGFVAQLSTVNVRAQDRITFTLPATVTYGDPPIALNAASSGARPLVYTNSTPTICQLVTGTPGTVRIIKVGTCTITAAQNGDNLADPVTQSMVIVKAPLTVKVLDHTREFGEIATVPCVLAPTFPGILRYSDTAADLGTLSCTTTATGSSPLGSYPLTPGGYAAPTAQNYDITYLVAKLTITVRKVTPTIPPVIVTSGQPVTLVATVPLTPSGIAPRGYIQFWFNGRLLASVQLVNGRAEYRFTPVVAVGTYRTEVRYLSTDTRFAPTGVVYGTMEVK